MAKPPSEKTASLGFEDKRWLAADVLSTSTFGPSRTTQAPSPD